MNFKKFDQISYDSDEEEDRTSYLRKQSKVFDALLEGARLENEYRHLLILKDEFLPSLKSTDEIVGYKIKIAYCYMKLSEWSKATLILDDVFTINDPVSTSTLIKARYMRAQSLLFQIDTTQKINLEPIVQAVTDMFILTKLIRENDDLKIDDIQISQYIELCVKLKRFQNQLELAKAREILFDKRFDDAIYFFRQCLERGSFPDLLQEWHSLLKLRGFATEKLPKSEEISQDSSRHIVELYKHYAYALQSVGDVTRAVEIYKKAAQMDHADARAVSDCLIRAAKLKLQTGDVAEARDLYALTVDRLKTGMNNGSSDPHPTQESPKGPLTKSKSRPDGVADTGRSRDMDNDSKLPLMLAVAQEGLGCCLSTLGTHTQAIKSLKTATATLSRMIAEKLEAETVEESSFLFVTEGDRSESDQMEAEGDSRQTNQLVSLLLHQFHALEALCSSYFHLNRHVHCILTAEEALELVEKYKYKSIPLGKSSDEIMNYEIRLLLWKGRASYQSEAKTLTDECLVYFDQATIVLRELNKHCESLEIEEEIAIMWSQTAGTYVTLEDLCYKTLPLTDVRNNGEVAKKDRACSAWRRLTESATNQNKAWMDIDQSTDSGEINQKQQQQREKLCKIEANAYLMTAIHYFELEVIFANLESAYKASSCMTDDELQLKAIICTLFAECCLDLDKPQLALGVSTTALELLTNAEKNGKIDLSLDVQVEGGGGRGSDDEFALYLELNHRILKTSESSLALLCKPGFNPTLEDVFNDRGPDIETTSEGQCFIKDKTTNEQLSSTNRKEDCDTDTRSAGSNREAELPSLAQSLSNGPAEKPFYKEKSAILHLLSCVFFVVLTLAFMFYISSFLLPVNEFSNEDL